MDIIIFQEYSIKYAYKKNNIICSTIFFGFFDEQGLPILFEQTPLKSGLWDNIMGWGYDYELLIPFDVRKYTVKEFYSLVKSFDLKGLELLSIAEDSWKITQSQKERIDFQYFSTALGKLIDPPTEENYLIILEELIAKHKNQFRN